MTISQTVKSETINAQNRNYVEWMTPRMVALPEQQLRYFTIEDLQSIEREYGVDIEIDTAFKPTALSELII